MRTRKVTVKQFENIVKQIIKEEEDGYSALDRHFSTDEFEDRYTGKEIYMIAQKLYEIGEIYDSMGETQKAQKYKAYAKKIAPDWNPY